MVVLSLSIPRIRIDVILKAVVFVLLVFIYLRVTWFTRTSRGVVFQAAYG